MGKEKKDETMTKIKSVCKEMPCFLGFFVLGLLIMVLVFRMFYEILFFLGVSTGLSPELCLLLMVLVMVAVVAAYYKITRCFRFGGLS